MATKKTASKKEDKEEKEETKPGKGKVEKDEKDDKAKAKPVKAKGKKDSESEAEEAVAEAPEEPAEPVAEAKPAEAKPAKAKAAKVVREPSSQAKVYQPANSYEVGETIFHPVWKVEGTVIEVGKTGDGIAKIVVDFPDLGIKRLVAEHNLKI